MTPLIPALAGALLVAGLIGIMAGLRRTPEPPPAPQRARVGLPGWVRSVTPRTRILILVGFGAAVAGLPALLSAPPAASQIERLEAMEEWTRSLSGVLTVGIGLEEALVATLRSAPDPIRPEVTRLVARLRARWSTEEALRMFADDLDDATGDLVAANLILAARRRGAGVASVLESLAESVAADVRARRAIEADRAKPRATARWVTLITIGVLAVLALTGSYITPYRTPLGQMILVLLLGGYVATLVWMRRMAAGKPLPRFIGATAPQQAKS